MSSYPDYEDMSSALTEADGIEQASEYKYPSQYHVKRDLVAASVSAANLESGW